MLAGSSPASSSCHPQPSGSSVFGNGKGQQQSGARIARHCADFMQQACLLAFERTSQLFPLQALLNTGTLLAVTFRAAAA
jgi:hypothetical protein